MPKRLITVPWLRLNGGAAIGVFGQTAGSVNLVDSSTTGFNAGPFALPEWIDTTREIAAYTYIRTILNSAVASKFVDLTLWATAVNIGAAPTEIPVTILFAIPNPWVSTDIRRLDFPNGTGLTFPANTFTAQQAVGFALTRNGGSPSDNYTQTVGVLACVILEAYVRCQAVCCSG